MFNVSGWEIIVILLLGLIVLGPDKLPDAMRRVGKVYGDLKRMSDTFQSEFRSVVDEPMNEVRQTAELIRKNSKFEPIPDDRLKRKTMDPATAMDPATTPEPDRDRDTAGATDPVADLGADAGAEAAGDPALTPDPAPAAAAVEPAPDPADATAPVDADDDLPGPDSGGDPR